MSEQVKTKSTSYRCKLGCHSNPNTPALTSSDACIHAASEERSTFNTVDRGLRSIVLNWWSKDDRKQGAVRKMYNTFGKENVCLNRRSASCLASGTTSHPWFSRIQYIYIYIYIYIGNNTYILL